jgi:hypothetical protein
MKVSGFTFIRNAIKYDFPVVEAIKSILPVCDDFYIAVGNSEDETLELVQSIDPKIHIQETIWDENLRKGGHVLAMETDKAKKMIPEDSDWCFYIQADEIIHEKYLETISEAMHKWASYSEVDGILLNYLHFYGSYDYIASSPQWYRNEIRIIKNDFSIYSFRDAQGFRKGRNKKLRVKPIDAWVYHYGWVKHPKIQYQKFLNSQKSYYDNDIELTGKYKSEEMEYGSIDFLERFTGTHPSVIRERVERINWDFDYDLSVNRMTFKNRLKYWVEKHFGFLPGEYKNYKVI